MKIYMAPMQGITTPVFRNLYEERFEGIAKYFTPFLVANQTKSFQQRELRDVEPARNKVKCLVPQVLTNQADQLVWAVFTLARLGYYEVNLNLGCSMPQVAKRGRGAGFLADPEKLDAFFDSFFTQMRGSTPLCLSVKTRVGVHSFAEARALLWVFNRYPFHELIVHPRLQEQVYEGKPDPDVFQMFYEECVLPLVYNGDVFTVEEYDALKKRFPDQDAVMLGRGLLRDPSLARRILGGEELSGEELASFHDSLLKRYLEQMRQEQQVVAKMKELWDYLRFRYPGRERELKAVRKARALSEYELAADSLLKSYLYT